jgi:hypothetical protein
MRDWAFNRHSGIHASMHVPCPGPCRMTKSVLRVHVHAACPYVHVHAACPCPCCMSMSMLHVHVHTACHVYVACSCQCCILCQCCIQCQCCIPCQCCILCQCFMSMSMSMYIYCRNAGMLDCLVSGQSGAGLKKLTMPAQVRYGTKLTQSGIFFSPVPD